MKTCWNTMLRIETVRKVFASIKPFRIEFQDVLVESGESVTKQNLIHRVIQALPRIPACWCRELENGN